MVSYTGAKEDGAAELRLAKYERKPEQEWLFDRVGENSYRIHCRANGKVIDLMMAGTDNGGACENPDELGWEKIDDHTVHLTFKEPMSELNFLNMMNRYFYILPEHIYSQYSIDELNTAAPWQENMIGSGPFVYDTSIDGERIELVKHEDYFLGEPQIDRLVIRVVQGSQLLSAPVFRHALSPLSVSFQTLLDFTPWVDQSQSRT